MDNYFLSINCPYSGKPTYTTYKPVFAALASRPSSSSGQRSLSRAPAPVSERQQPDREGERLMANPSLKCLQLSPSE